MKDAIYDATAPLAENPFTSSAERGVPRLTVTNTCKPCRR